MAQMQPELIEGIRKALRSRIVSAVAFNKMIHSRPSANAHPVMSEASLRLVAGHQQLLADFEAWVATQGTPAPAATLGDAASDPYTPPQP